MVACTALRLPFSVWQIGSARAMARLVGGRVDAKATWGIRVNIVILGFRVGSVLGGIQGNPELANP